jgi:alpha-glucosidase
MQRIATTWTGDNFTSFRELRYNHYQAMTMSLSGFAFYGQDIGGFSGPSPSRRLFLRWLQYAMFTPRFVLHSCKPGEPSTMPWLYEDMMDDVKRLFRLREKMAPYLFEEMNQCVKENKPLIYPVFLLQKDYDREADCYMCGRRILACPVFDEDQNSVHVLLPSFSDWKLRGTGKTIKGGTERDVTCLPCDLPVWFEKA